MTAITVPTWEDRDWTASALCAQADPETFFPPKGGDVRPGKRICGACEVKTECLAYALANHPLDGTWGGTSERERRRMRPAQPPVGGQPRTADCGTPSGARWHYRHGEKPCLPCREANARDRRERADRERAA